MQPPPDNTAPKTQRRLWRRVWVGLALFLVLTLLAAWVAIDQGGKAEWRRVQDELRAKGEATTLDDLRLPTRADIPDAENFCALPWLIANEDGDASPEMEEVAAAMSAFGGSRQEPDLFTRARGRQILGMARDFDALDRNLELAAEENGSLVNEEDLLEAGDDPLARIRARLASVDHYWTDAEAVRNRPQAVWLPTTAERLHYQKGNIYLLSHPHFRLAQSTSSALAIRAGFALHEGDYETALRSLEIAMRMAEACTNESNFLGGLVAITIHSIHINIAIECLWEEGIQNDPVILKRLQAILNSWQVTDLAGKMVRGEMLFHNQMMLWASENRAQAAALYGQSIFGENPSTLYHIMRIAPQGWFHSNAAYPSEILNNTLLEGIRQGTIPEILAANERLSKQSRAQTQMERFYHVLSSGNFIVYEKLMQRLAYPEAVRRQASITCALYRFRIDHAGELPDALSQLLPDYLESIPTDPIDGAPMRYQKTPTAKAPFLLYSIGIDATDDGGILQLDPDEPLRTRTHNRDYLGDWPWPVIPGKLPPPEE